MHTCDHCNIIIDPKFDQAHEVESDIAIDVLCDSCFNDWSVDGDDAFRQCTGECKHKVWAKQDVAERTKEAIAV